MSTSDSSHLSPWAKDETGNVYGRLTVLEPAGRQGGQLLWSCRCECGNLTKVTGGDLRRSTTVSCGCKRQSAGGMHKSPEYTTWKEMKRRCYRPKTPYYELYGGRGITVCDRWLASFKNFFEDMGPKPSPEMTIDRIDGDGNYEPENCRWATPTEQARNTNKAVLLTHNGITDTIRGWARRLDMQHCVLRYRLRRGWPLYKVLTSQRFGPPPGGVSNPTE